MFFGFPVTKKYLLPKIKYAYDTTCIFLKHHALRTHTKQLQRWFIASMSNNAFHKQEIPFKHSTKLQTFMNCQSSLLVSIFLWLPRTLPDIQSPVVRRSKSLNLLNQFRGCPSVPFSNSVSPFSIGLEPRSNHLAMLETIIFPLSGDKPTTNHWHTKEKCHTKICLTMHVLRISIHVPYAQKYI